MKKTYKYTGISISSKVSLFADSTNFLKSLILTLVLFIAGIASVWGQVPGNNCATAVALTSPAIGSTITTGAQTTCGRVGDFAAGFSSVNTSYGGGEDGVYSMVVPAGGGNYTFTFPASGATYKILSIHSACAPSTANTLGGFVTGAGTGGSVTLNLTAGTRFIIIDTWPAPNCGAFTLNITRNAPATQPGNNCATAVGLTSPAIGASISTGDATTCGRVGDFAAGFSSVNTSYGGGEDGVYSMVVPAGGGNYTFSFAASGATYKILSIHSACAPTTANTLGGFVTGTGTGGTWTGNLPAGTVFIVIDTWPSPNCGIFNLTITRNSPPPAAPANDVCASATNLPCGTSSLAGTTVSTLAETAPGTCVGTNGVWYSFVGDGQLTTISAFSTMDIGVYIASGTCAARTQLQCIDGFSGNSTETSSAFLTTVGVTYYVYIANFTGSTTGTFTISRTCTAPPTPPANDLVCSAVAITCGSTLSGTTLNATNSGTGENQTCGTAQTMPGVWYVVAGNGQQMTASLCATTWDSKISVFSGSTCSSLTCLGGNDDAGPACSGASASYSWTSVIGTNYYILVHGYSTNSTFSLSLSCSAPPVTYISQWIGMNTGSSSWCAGETRNVSVTLKNNGTATWTDASPDINIGVKWNTDSDYNVRINAGNLSPGATQTYIFNVTAPTTLGSNNLTFDVVYEGCFWFASNAVISGSCPAAGPGNLVYTSSNITINSIPSLSVSSNPGTICAGQTSSLLATTTQNFTYCSADATNTLFEKISNVTIGTINNNSTSTSGYENFTAQSTNITAGVSIPISVGVSSAYANDDRVHIWADINQNGVFDEPSERLSDLAVSTFCSSCSGTAATLTGNIIIPTSSFNGTTRLRVRLQDQSSGANSTSCGSSSYGQVEDYTINISGGTVNNSISYVWSPSGTLSSSTISNPTASPVNTTTYSVTATSAAGCTSSSTTIISVNQLPLTNVSQSNLLLCPGGTTNVTVVASGGQSPYTGIGTFTVSEGNQSFTVTDANGCQTTSTINVQSNDNIPPSITAPATITVSANPGSCIASSVPLGLPSVNDNCTVVSVTSNAPSVFPVGTTTVIWTAQDISGNISTASQTVVVSGDGINYWTGNINSDWFNSSNWCSGVPTISTDVQIPANVLNMPVISGAGAVCRNITINSTAIMTINTTGTLTVSGDFSNSGSYVSNSGKTIFQSISSQQLTGSTTFWDLELNNTAGLTINSNVTVLNSAVLNSGTLTTGSNILQITNGGYLSNGSGYVNGFLRKYVDVGSGTSMYYEVGSVSEYAPLSINFNNVTGAGYLTVNSISSDHPAILSSGFDVTKTVNRYWNLTGGTGLSFDFYSLDLNYVNADKDPGFVQAYSGAKIYNSSSWIETNPVYSNNNSLTVDSVNVLGGLQIGIFNPRPNAYLFTPNYGYVGATANVVLTGTGFLSGISSVNTVNDVTINSLTVNSDTAMTLNVTINPNANAGVRKFAVSNISNAIGYGGVSDSLDFNIWLKPDVNFYASTTAVKCYLDQSVEFYNYSLYGASYYWDFGSGATPSTANGFGPHSVTYSTTGLKTVSLIAFSPIGNDTLVRTNFINVSAIAPASPAIITGASNICAYGTSNLTYSVPSVSGVTGYAWTVPSGVNIVSGIGTSSIVVNFPTTFSSGVISVTQSNSCGTSTLRSLTIIRASAVPGSISGPSMVCGLTTATYSIAAVTGATGYIWTLPSGVTSTLGSSPITTTSTSLPVVFASTFSTGAISVQSFNSCGASTARSLSISRSLIPGSISGLSMVCGLTTASYSITAVSGATGYVWTLPSGVTSTLGASPITTTSTSLPVVFASTFNSGTISVQSLNSCGTSTLRSLTITKITAVPGAISGPTMICGLTSATYSIAAVSGATGYVWTLPSGVTSSLGTSPITTTSTSLPVVFASTFSTGAISVQSLNSCGSSTARSLTITKAPGVPGSISGPSMVCGLTTASYTIAAVTGATSYVWTLPSGVTSTLGASPITTTSTSLTVVFASTFNSGTISVKSSNECISSSPRGIIVSRAPSTPGVISGPVSICDLSSATYSVAPVAGANTYTWSLPTGITTANGINAITTNTPSINVIISTAFVSGNITVKANGSCASSGTRIFVLGSCVRSVDVVFSGQEDQKTVSATLYPNPSNGAFNVEYISEITSEMLVQIFDMQGRTVLERKEYVLEGANVFDFSNQNLYKGTYFVRLLDEQNEFTETKILIVQ